MAKPAWLHTGVGSALLAAGLFGASTPFAKLLVGQVSPLLLAGLLYAGSGLGLSVWALIRGRSSEQHDAALTRRDAPWLAGAVVFGGVIAPALLMWGLTTTAAADASLLLNLESVLTAVLAWVVFRENVDRRIFLGMVVIVAGGVLLSWDPRAGGGLSWGALGIAGACLAWAIDNNLTRQVSGGDPVQIAAIKGLVSGAINTSLALVMGATLPGVGAIAGALGVGFLGYGVSLVLFVLALRHLGTARTGAYFSTAPFVGASLSLLMLGESATLFFWLAGALMAIGVWLHVTERHEHEHTHEVMEHEHRHSHDEHHQHAHDFSWGGEEPHTHQHRQEPMTHSHTHYPDLHHRHTHS